VNTVTDTKAPDRALFWIYDRGTHALETATNERAFFTAQFQRTPMVGIAGTRAQARIQVRRAHGGTDRICTPFFGH
jgi:hypothetical protein